MKDLSELPKTARSELKIIPVKHMDDVLKLALSAEVVNEPPKPRKQNKEDVQEDSE